MKTAGEQCDKERHVLGTSHLTNKIILLFEAKARATAKRAVAGKFLSSGIEILLFSLH